jgi:hypothetical protein
LTLPAFVVANTQDGIARSHDWMRLGLVPQFIVRQSLIIGLTAGAFVLGRAQLAVDECGESLSEVVHAHSASPCITSVPPPWVALRVPS